jgi:hypothetical protein
MTPLHLAVDRVFEAGDVRILISLLIHGGADTTIKDKKSRTAKDLAKQLPASDPLRSDVLNLLDPPSQPWYKLA